MYLLKPFSGSPCVSLNAALLILSMYSPRAAAVVISFAVYEIGRPICSVNSFASLSCRSRSSLRAFLTIACRSDNVVRLNDSNASCALFGIVTSSLSEGPVRVRIGLLVEGEMVVSVSTAILPDMHGLIQRLENPRSTSIRWRRVKTG